MKWRVNWPAIALCLLFLFTAAHRIETPGIQADEALFSMGNFYPQGVAYGMKAFGYTIPLMQMSYLGSFKAWVYAPIFKTFGVSPATIRLPMVLLGAVTLYLLYLFLSSTVSPAAGLMALALLALEPTFLWTTRCDWGPVAIEHFLIVSAVFAVYRRKFPLAAFLIGLACWNKLTALWIVFGLSTAGLLLYGHLLRKTITLRAVALSLIVFTAGAYPLIRYNYTSRGRTAQQTARFSLEGVDRKVDQMQFSLRGDALVGYLIPDDEGVGFRRTFIPEIFACGLIASIIARSRLAFFCLIGPALGWALMLITRGAGASAHHAVLMWPWPHAFAAIALTQALRKHRAVLSLVGLIALISCAAVNLHFFDLLATRGTYPPWSDAIYPLVTTLESAHPDKVYINGWGILDQVRLLSAGRLKVDNSTDLPPERYFNQPNALFVQHTPEWEAVKGTNQRFAPRQQITHTIQDSKGRPIFQIFRVAPPSTTGVSEP